MIVAIHHAHMQCDDVSDSASMPMVYAQTVNMPLGCKRVRLKEEYMVSRKVCLGSSDNICV